MIKQIIALGGGGFSMEPDNPLLDNYILKQVEKENPKICFIGTASGDSEDYINRFYTAFNHKKCSPTHLSLFKGETDKIEELILSQDIIYVGGRNTRNMLVIWKEWGLDNILKKAYNNGILLCGISAGSICWFEEGLTDSIPNQLNKLDCLGILEGSNCPHFDGEKERQDIYKNKIRSDEMKKGIACDDDVGLHFINNKLEKVISSKADSFAYSFMSNNNEIIEKKLNPIRL